LLLGAAQMLDHLGQAPAAQRLRAAIRSTIVAKDRATPDLGGAGSTATFADAIIERL
jgi:isocitrate dehydrogenase (NAD+)